MFFFAWYWIFPQRYLVIILSIVSTNVTYVCLKFNVKLSIVIRKYCRFRLAIQQCFTISLRRVSCIVSVWEEQEFNLSLLNLSLKTPFFESTGYKMTLIRLNYMSFIYIETWTETWPFCHLPVLLNRIGISGCQLHDMTYEYRGLMCECLTGWGYL